MKDQEKKCKTSCGGCGGAAYGLGVLGALMYNLSVTTGFWPSIVSILKALVWPAYVVYYALKFFGA